MKRPSFQAVVLLILGFAGGVGAMRLAGDRYELHVQRFTEGSEQMWRLDKWTGRTWLLVRNVWITPVADGLHPNVRFGTEK